MLQKDDREELPEWEQLYEVGILAEIERAFKLPDGNMQLVMGSSACAHGRIHTEGSLYNGQGRAGR